MHIKRFNEILEGAIAIPKFVKPEKLPHCADMEAKGYRIAEIGGSKYAFHKGYEADEDIYWLGKDTEYYKYGHKYIASPEVVGDKKNDAFYSLYCKCDDSPTEAQKKIIAEREKENAKRQEALQKQIRTGKTAPPKKKK